MSTIQRMHEAEVPHELVPGRRVKLAAGIIAFVVATAAGAQWAVPLPWTPVPMTLQPFFVILSGALLGARGGAAAMAAYVLVGAAGAPVFSQGNGGVAWLAGPTGGYLLAYPVAAFLVGLLASTSRSLLRQALALSVGLLVIYLGGVSQLFLLTRQDAAALLQQGVLPFLSGDLVKLLMALAIMRSVRNRWTRAQGEL